MSDATERMRVARERIAEAAEATAVAHERAAAEHERHAAIAEVIGESLVDAQRSRELAQHLRARARRDRLVAEHARESLHSSP
jgi:hypothetical protein